MRATISFETDLDQVEGTMAVLACSEEHNLRAAADLLSNFTVLDGSVLDAITEVLRLVDASAQQLRQYQQMMASFEKSRFETLLPQSAPNPVKVHGAGEEFSSPEELKEIVARANKFGSFLGDINDTPPGGVNDSEKG